MLNLANYSTVWNDDFTRGSMPANMGVVWGNADEYSYSNQGLTLTSDGASAGFLTADSGPSSGDGYGLYQITLTQPQNQANGSYVCLWPGSNVWPGPELDFIEQMNGQSFMTIHWKGSDGSNQYQSLPFATNTNNPTTLAMDWERNALTFYCNGQEVISYPAGGSVPVPLDYADGGENEAFGVGNVGPAGVTMTISNMSYSKYTPGGGTGGGSISLSAPGTVQEASVGAGVNVTETVTASGLSTIYEAVFNAANQAEGGWTKVNLTNGTGTFTAHFAHSGDYVEAVNATSNPTVTGTSAAITITDPKATAIGISSPGTVTESSPGAGANVTETFTAQGFSTIYEAVFNSSNVAEENWQAVSLNANGVGTATVHFEHSGDYVVAVDQPTNYTISGWSTTVTLTDTPAKPQFPHLTGDNLYANSKAGTVIGTVSAKSPDPLSFSLRHNPNNMFAIKGNQLVLATAMPANPASSYNVSLIATDTRTGATCGKVLTIDVNAAKATAAITALSVTSATPGFVAASVVRGAGVAITPGAAGDTVTFGAGDATVAAGGGASEFVWHAGSGLDVIQGFAAHDTLAFDHALQGTLHVSHVSGGTQLSFGDANLGILLAGVSQVGAGQIHFV